MDGVIFPQYAAMEGAVIPVEQKIGDYQIADYLHPQRQMGNRAVPVFVEVGDLLAVRDMEDHDGETDREPDAQVPDKKRDEKPVAQIGKKPALFPPGPAAIERHPARQDPED